MAYELNETQTRAITDDCFLGVACYEGSVEGQEFVGRLAGNAETLEVARAWLRGKDAPLRRPVLQRLMDESKDNCIPGEAKRTKARRS